MAVLRPLKMTVENYPKGQVEEFEAPNHPADPAFGSRLVRFAREVFIEHDDFSEKPPPGFRRLAPGREVRLRYAYLVTCHEVVKDATGSVVELRCSYNPDSRGGNAGDGRKVGATIHWVSAAEGVRAEVRLYDRLFSAPSPADFVADLNRHSMRTLSGSLVERAAASDPHGQAVKFERQGYFSQDDDSLADRLVFNRTASLRESPGKPSTTQTAFSGNEVVPPKNT